METGFTRLDKIFMLILKNLVNPVYNYHFNKSISSTQIVSLFR
jgi:hypothetical protein